jgi:photosystem II stability/assembly factor-like uncharacterized protein
VFRGWKRLAAGVAVAVACGQRAPDGRPQGADDPDARVERARASGGPVAPGYLDRKLAVVRSAQREAASTRRALTTPQPQWTNLGPTDVESTISYLWHDSGRLRAIVPHPTNPRILYLGTAAGGVWKTTDADPAPGAVWSWRPLTDELPGASAWGNIGVGGLALDAGDPETLYLALGDPMAPGGAKGLFVSHDGGSSWNLGGSLGPTLSVYQVMSPAPRVVLAGGSHGLFRSSDGGQSFSPATFTGSAPGVATVWSLTAFGDGTLACSRGVSAIDTRIWLSRDDGATWSQATVSGVPQLGRVTIAASGTVGYAVCASSDYKILNGVLKSADSGKTWSFMENTGGYIDEAQASYNQSIAVDPDDADHVFLGVRSPYRSLDGGKSWLNVGLLHADQQAAAFSRTGVKVLYTGSDGGLALHRDPFAAEYDIADNTHNRGISTFELYSVAGSGNDDALIGTQDNGSRRRIGASGKFTIVTGGDGFGAIIHPLDPQKFLASANGSITGNPWPSSPGPLQFDVKLVPDLADAAGNTVYTLGSNLVYRSTDFGQSWTSLAPLDGLYPIGLAAARGTVFIVNGSESRLSTDAGKSWKPIHIPGCVTTCGWIDGAGRLYACSGLIADDIGHLLRSRDAGATWESLESAGFPRGLPVHVVRTAPSADATIYAGTDVGAYLSTDDGRSWSRLGAGLPWVAVRDLWLSPDGERLLAATYGRGVWELRLTDKPPPPPAVAVTPASKAILAGSEAEFQVHVDGLGSFPTLGLEGVPPGVHWSFSPPSSTSSLLKLSVDAGQPASETRLSVTAASGMSTTHTPLDLSIRSDGGHVSAVSLDPAVVALSAGRTSGVRIQVDATAPTTFEATSLPPGATAVFDPVSLPGSGTTTMTVRADPSAPDSQGTARVAARTLGESATGQVEITVAARPSVRILSPVAGAPLTSPVEIAAEATFSAFAAAGKLEIFADEALVGTGRTSARVSWTGSSGPHTLLARATDARGEIAETAVRVEMGGSAPNPPPSLPPTTPADPPPDHLATSRGCGSAGADLLAMLGLASAFRVRRVRKAPSPRGESRNAYRQDGERIASGAPSTRAGDETRSTQARCRSRRSNLLPPPGRPRPAPGNRRCRSARALPE